MKTIFFFLIISFSTILFSTIINIPADQPTIQAGINASVNTDTVLVQPGTYFENINYNGKNITVASLFLTTQDTTYISQTVIDGSNMDIVVRLEIYEEDTTRIIGFTITNGLYMGIYCNDNSNPNIQNVTIVANTIITGNTGGGIVCDYNSYLHLQNITITDNIGSGISCGMCQIVILEDVTISNNSATGVGCFESNIQLQNVTITDNSGGGIYCDFRSNVDLVNCILWNDSPQEISLNGGEFDESFMTIFYSDLQGGVMGIVSNEYGYIWGDEGNIDEDPLFIDPIAGDYHLTENSPCINAGHPSTPLDPDGTIADMGAYYYHINPTIINVPADQPTIQAGIDVASDADTVLVQPGTYYENINYNGKNIIVASLFLTTQDTSYISQTIIDGNQSGSVVTFNNNEDSTAVLCGFTITNGLGDGSFPEPYAGGITCGNSSSPSLEYVTISGNTAINGGGGIFCFDHSSPSLEYVNITGNTASEYTSLIGGGGICCYYHSNATLKNVTISDNSVETEGGGLYSEISSPSLENVIITGNSAGSGGGISCIDSSPSLENVIITGNSASSGRGGGISGSFSTMSLKKVTISGNIANIDGGGIYCFGCSPSLEYVIITGNSAAAGGGISCELYSNPSLLNVTISDNSALVGGGIYCYSYTNPNLINTILWNNSPEEIVMRSGGDPNSITISYTEIQGGEAGIVTNNYGTVYWLDGNIDEDPLFVNPLTGDYHLTVNSPCIDAGDPASPLDPDGTIADMGAYYFHQSGILNPPQHLSVEIIVSNVLLSWDAVGEANSYKVFSSDDPYSGFVEDTSGSFAGESWSTSIINEKKFYYVKASTEIIRFKRFD